MTDEIEPKKTANKLTGKQRFKLSQYLLLLRDSETLDGKHYEEVAAMAESSLEFHITESNLKAVASDCEISWAVPRRYRQDRDVSRRSSASKQRSLGKAILLISLELGIDLGPKLGTTISEIAEQQRG
jgi:hypothetical protein